MISDVRLERTRSGFHVSLSPVIVYYKETKVDINTETEDLVVASEEQRLEHASAV